MLCNVFLILYTRRLKGQSVNNWSIGVSGVLIPILLNSKWYFQCRLWFWNLLVLEVESDFFLLFKFMSEVRNALLRKCERKVHFKKQGVPNCGLPCSFDWAWMTNMMHIPFLFEAIEGQYFKL